MLMRTSAPLHPAETRKTRLNSILLASGVATLIAFVLAAVWLSLFRPRTMQSYWAEDGAPAAAVLIFLGTYAVLAIGKLPGFHMDRAGAALLGASLMVATGLLSLDNAYRAIAIDTIALL